MTTRIAPVRWLWAAVLAGPLLLPPAARAADGDALSRLENAVVSLAEKAARSVVSVQVANRNSPVPRPPGKADPAEAHQRFRDAVDKSFLLSNAWGSGFAVDADHVATSARVVPPGVTQAVVLLQDGENRKAEVVGRSDEDNTVLLKVERGGLTPAAFASTPARVGDLVMTVGNSFQVIDRMRRPAFSLGVVSGIYEPKKGFTTYYSGAVLETDAAVNPGNYGGPLVNARGEVVGMVASTFSFRRWLGCAVPVDRVRRALARIRGEETAPIGRESFDVPALGVTLKPAPGGWEILAVLDGGPARALGWRPKDRIVLLDGAVPEGGAREALDRFKAGSKMKVRLSRDGWEKDFEVDLAGPGEEGDEF